MRWPARSTSTPARGRRFVALWRRLQTLPIVTPRRHSGFFPARPRVRGDHPSGAQLVGAYAGPGATRVPGASQGLRRAYIVMDRRPWATTSASRGHRRGSPDGAKGAVEILHPANARGAAGRGEGVRATPTVGGAERGFVDASSSVGDTPGRRRRPSTSSAPSASTSPAAARQPSALSTCVIPCREYTSGPSAEGPPSAPFVAGHPTVPLVASPHGPALQE